MLAREGDNGGLSVSIAGRRVADGEPVFVVAEAGVNHCGELENALALVDAAAEAGADAVKFQMFRSADLVTSDAPCAGYQRRSGATSQRSMLERLELGLDDFPKIARRCRQRQVQFLATPFGPEQVPRVTALGPPAIKVASTDIDNAPLLRSVAATGLPVILSTGASSRGEISDAVSLLEGLGARDRLVLLHCVSAYPTPWNQVNLLRIRALMRSFHVVTGFSDHTVQTSTGALAAAAGACVLEKHLTLDRSLPGPDHAMSLCPWELGQYVRSIRDAEEALGDGAIRIGECEYDVRRVARKSVVAARDIRAGEVLTENMCTLKRPGTGLAASMIPSMIGRTARRSIDRDTVLSWDMLE